MVSKKKVNKEKAVRSRKMIVRMIKLNKRAAKIE